MLDNNLIQSTSSWPFVEIRKLLKDRKDIIKKNKVNKKIIPNSEKYSPPTMEEIKMAILNLNKI